MNKILTSQSFTLELQTAAGANRRSPNFWRALSSSTNQVIILSPPRRAVLIGQIREGQGVLSRSFVLAAILREIRRAPCLRGILNASKIITVSVPHSVCYIASRPLPADGTLTKLGYQSCVHSIKIPSLTWERIMSVNRLRFETCNREFFQTDTILHHLSQQANVSMSDWMHLTLVAEKGSSVSNHHGFCEPLLLSPKPRSWQKHDRVWAGRGWKVE